GRLTRAKRHGAWEDCELRDLVRSGIGRQRFLARAHQRRREQREGDPGQAASKPRQSVCQLVQEGHGVCSMARARCPEAAGAATDEWGVWTTRREGQSAVRRTRTAALARAALVNERRCDSLNPNGMDAGVPFTARRGLGGRARQKAADEDRVVVSLAARRT